MLENYLFRLKKMDALIKRKSTGTPHEFARRMDLSESALYEYLVVLKQLGAPVKYCRRRRSYYYSEVGEFYLEFRKQNK